MVSHHAVESPVARGGEYPRSSVHGRGSESGLGGALTDVWTTEGWRYLAVILALYSRRVIGWAMGHRLTVDLAERALTMALTNRTPTAGLLHHSDRGSQYAATSDQQLLAAHGITASMSRNGNCWDHAGIERFFGTRKRARVPSARRHP